MTSSFRVDAAINMQLFLSVRQDDTSQAVIRRSTDAAVRAEKCGFHGVWVSEHHSTRWNVCPDPLTLLAFVAARTETIRLGTAVVNLPLHHPRAIAERARLIDVLSNGRLDLGIGRGFATTDYRMFGGDESAARDTFHAKHEALAAHLVSECEGMPLPVQRPTPPIWLAVSGDPRALSFAAANGYGLLLASSGEKLLTNIRTYRREWSDRGTVGAPRIGLSRGVHVAATRDQAAAQLEEPLRWYLRRMAELQPAVAPPSVDEVIETFFILGSPADCLTQIRSLRAATGFEQLNCIFGLAFTDHARARDSVDAFASDVMPHLHLAAEATRVKETLS